ncbi:HopJ type III effector protein [uncultured Endozoicomonas sp.]|uniref:HopJ type III effector protein n=1 Tax=uncultured Endozoicomonas sp. TaxID=432652 RepID=UPI0026342F96|nr:HopJ type III effector protein [uncultured Endozoicomonas sp.]
MSLNQLLEQIRNQPDQVEFQTVITVIADHYDYTPTCFTNGTQMNEAGTNEGSCKILSFGQLNQLSSEETLACFGSFYRDEVLNDPAGTSHGNIRAFMETGWSGVSFDHPPLVLKEK